MSKKRRIDYILNSKNPIQAVMNEMGMDCDLCPGQDYDCEERCSYYLRRYLEQEIEVNESDLKVINDKKKEVNVSVEATDEQIDTKEALDDVKEPVENDPVNHPTHYTDTKIEVIDYIEDKGLNFNRGNVIKYVSRAGKKDPNKEVEDLEKARFYLNREIERLEKLQNEK